MNIKKEITFIHMDHVEHQIYEPIAKEAQRRGYTVKFSTNKCTKCEIGFYCQHVNFPEYSKFSVIMLHDIIQQYSNWPDLWFREPWNIYNIGILPGATWENNWNQCSKYYYANPKNGMYKVGWPKADVIGDIDIKAYRRENCKKYGIDLNKKSILYAPSWECDGKQNDFVQSMLKLDVNILIKQYAVDPELFPNTYKEIQRMYELHKNNPRVIILDSKINILNAIALSDILVSDESSTMCEAVMMGIPAVSVSNWLIPDVTPKRYPSVKYDFVSKTTKENLTNHIYYILENYSVFKKEAEDYSRDNFPNIGKCASIIMDIVDDVLLGKTPSFNALPPQNRERVPFKKNIIHKCIRIKNEIVYNYMYKYKFIGYGMKVYRFIKKKIFHKNLGQGANV